MAHVYIRSLAAGAGTGVDWANAYTTEAAALTAKAAGDNLWMSEDHAETQASAMTLTSPGTLAAPCTIICVNHLGTVPPVSADLATTATVTTTGANSMTFAGYAYRYGITYNAGSGAVSSTLNLGSGATAFWHYFKNCALQKLGTAAQLASLNIGQGNSSLIDARLVLDNTTVRFGNVGDGIRIAIMDFLWKNTVSAVSASGSTPTTLFSPASLGVNSNRICQGVDLSLITGTLVGAQTSGGRYVFEDVKLGAGVAVATPTIGGPEILIIRGDSGATNYRHEKYNYYGTQTVETTIVRTGGASDGVTSIAWKIVTTANSKWITPFECMPIAIPNSSTSSVTLTVYGIWGGGAVPNNDEIWLEIAYLGSAATPLATINTATTKADYLATAAGQGTDAVSVWGGSTTAFKMAATFTPAQKGPISVIVKAAKLSSTFYIDPRAVLS